MTTKLDLTPDEVLTTTRSVRKRLDLDRPVDRAVIEECLEIALQAPTGSNRNIWRWVLVDDPELIRSLGALYVEAGEEYRQIRGAAYFEDVMPRHAELMNSADHLKRNLGRVPIIVMPLMKGRVEGLSAALQASHWGSILPAVWSLFLALRQRGLGAAWTSVHLVREREAADLLGIPHDEYTQAGLFPVAYTIGTDFKKALRKPLAEVSSWNCFGEP